jgi:hypothetical protein
VCDIFIGVHVTLTRNVISPRRNKTKECYISYTINVISSIQDMLHLLYKECYLPYTQYAIYLLN